MLSRERKTEILIKVKHVVTKSAQNCVRYLFSVLKIRCFKWFSEGLKT